MQLVISCYYKKIIKSSFQCIVLLPRSHNFEGVWKKKPLQPRDEPEFAFIYCRGEISLVTVISLVATAKTRSNLSH